MGLLTKIFKDSSDSEFKLAQDLVAIAIADGGISILCSEFHSMGIDYETVLVDEQELAIRRWMST